jgi:DNA-3-methyladenine glycosylase I
MPARKRSSGSGGEKRPAPAGLSAGVERCAWAKTDPLMVHYHDTEWGVPERNSTALWGKLALDSFQAGLSWLTILRKRDAFHRAFAGFDPVRVARFGPAEIAKLLDNPEIVRSRAKIQATINNARAFLKMAEAGEDFSSFVWGMASGKPVHNHWRTMADVPAKSALSEQLSTELKRRGFSFVGPVIVYAWMQGSGIVNDHITTCFRHGQCG